MATNVVGYISDIGKGMVEVHFLGAAGIGAVDDGYWLNVQDLKEGSLHITGITTATVQIYGANVTDEPADATDHIQIGADISSNAVFDMDSPVKWMKVKVSAHTTGTIKAIMLAHRS